MFSCEKSALKGALQREKGKPRLMQNVYVQDIHVQTGINLEWRFRVYFLKNPRSYS
jgi:hypothetical protein